MIDQVNEFLEMLISPFSVLLLFVITAMWAYIDALRSTVRKQKKHIEIQNKMLDMWYDQHSEDLKVTIKKVE